MSVQMCGLEGCHKPIFGPKHLTCSETHHLLLMAARFARLHPTEHPPPPSFSPEYCAFSQCSQPPCPGDDFCSRSHHLDWLRCVYANLRTDQICRLSGCYRHVFVKVREDGSLRAHEFCGWTHCKEFHIRSSVCGENNSPLQHSVESYMESLKAYTRNKSFPPRNVEVDEAFFTKHPWNVLDRPEFRNCWLIARCLFKDNERTKRNLFTRDAYHWKQQGKPFRHNSEVLRKHFTYTLLRGRKHGRDEFQDAAFTMTEYTLRSPANEEEKNYCVVQVCRKQQKKRARRNLKAHPEASVRSSSHDEAQNSLMQPSTTNQMGLTAAPVADQVVSQSGDTMPQHMMGLTEETQDTEEIQHIFLSSDQDLLTPLSEFLPPVEPC